MTLHAEWIGEGGRKAQHPPDPRYPLGIVVDGSAGRPSCSVSLEYPAPFFGQKPENWLNPQWLAAAARELRSKHG
jgi:hypothetical protein